MHAILQRTRARLEFKHTLYIYIGFTPAEGKLLTQAER